MEATQSAEDIIGALRRAKETDELLGPELLDLRGVRFTDADLSGLDLTGCNFSGCEMSNCTYNPGQCIGAGNNPDCPPLATEELCDANDSCTWWSATCQGAATLCSEFEDQLSCDQVECIWF